MSRALNYCVLASAIAGLLVAGGPARAGVWYVDDDAAGAGTGLNWDDAFVHLQDALAVAVDGDEIRVAQGVYRPDERSDWPPGGSGDRAATFWLISGVGLYGGYAGVGAPDPDERDIALYETILSGDLAEDDGPGEWEDYDENSYHVVTGSGTDATATLDGFTITAGNADASSGPNHEGGGMYNEEGSPTLIQCTFMYNYAQGPGGGMLNAWYSDPVLTNCAFGGNRANQGGGIYNRWYSSPNLAECTFIENRASWGGGMYNYRQSSPVLNGCEFSQNSASYSGGGMGSYDECSPTLTFCTFGNNAASSWGGGGMHNSWYSGPSLTDCTFVGNRTADDGGAIGNSRGYYDSATITRCTFKGNSASGRGGAVFGSESHLIFVNCFFAAGSAEAGGAIHTDRSSPSLVGCQFVGNLATNGGGMHFSGGRPRITNCDFVANSAENGSGVTFVSVERDVWPCADIRGCVLWDGGDEIRVVDTSEPTVRYCDVQGGWEGYGNLQIDPSFVRYPDDGGDGWGDDPDTPDVDEGANDDYGDLHLLAGSPCINKGWNYAPELLEEDFEGNPRIQQCRVDMGAYESPYAPTAFPDCNENGLDDDCEIYDGAAEDCNENHVIDECDIAQGTSYDSDGSGVPDECEDCNGNGVPDALDPSRTLFSNVWDWAGALDTTAPVAQDIHLPGRAQLRMFLVYYTSTGSSSGNMMVRFYQGGNDGSVLPVYPEGLLGEYSLGHLPWLPGDESSFKYLRVEPALPLPSHLWMEVEISKGGGVVLSPEPPMFGFTQGSVYDRRAGEMLVGPLYMGLKIEGLQCELDCNGNNIEDACDVACGPVGGPCDVFGCGQSDDCNANGVPDECEPDCNENGVADECDIIAGTSDDDNDNGTPDECEPAADIKPGACPNSFNRNSHGVLPVGLLGTGEFNITEVDVSTVRLSRADGIGGQVTPHEGPPGPHSVYQDVGTPFEGQPCACHDAAGDGILDLSMKFKTDDVTANLLLNELAPGALVELVVRGNLLDGSAFAGSDCIRLVPSGTPPGLVGIQSNAAGAWIEVEPLDLQLDGGGFTDFERSYPLGSVVTLTAQPTHQAKRFVGWRLHGEFQTPDSSVGFATTEDLHTVEVVLLRRGDMDGDDHVDLADFATFATCYGLGGPHAECEAQEFAASDLDADGQVDLSDFATFALNFGS